MSDLFLALKPRLFEAINETFTTARLPEESGPGRLPAREAMLTSDDILIVKTSDVKVPIHARQHDEAAIFLNLAQPVERLVPDSSGLTFRSEELAAFKFEPILYSDRRSR